MRMGTMGVNLYPIRIGGKIKLLEKDGKISNEEVFKAVCNGIEIDMGSNGKGPG